MKIIHVCSSDITAYFLLRSQLRHFQDNGAEVNVVCSDGTWIKSLKEEGIAVTTIEISREITPKKDLLALMEMIRCFKREKPDIVHTHTMKGALLGLLASVAAGVSLRFNTIHGFFFSEDSSLLKRVVFSNLERLHALLCTHTMCQNPIDTDIAIKQRIVSKKSITTIGNGVNISRFSNEKIDKKNILECKKELNIGEEDFVVGIIARMVREKGYIELAKAFAHFQTGKKDVKLLVIGEPDYTKPDFITIDSIKEFVPVNTLRYLTHTDNVPLYLSCMSVYVLPSYREGFPRSVLEAEAMGLPVVVAESNGGRAAVEHGINGYHVPIGKYEEIAEYLDLLYKDRSLLKTIGVAAREKAVKDFNETEVFNKIWTVYTHYYRKHS